MTKIIDLFAGVGGLSLSAARAGFDVAAAVEWDSHAISSHAKNFPSSVHLQCDIATLSGKELLKQAGLKQGELVGLVGGPPCQGFSNMGKREVTDPRNNLFSHFFRLVAQTRPAFFVAENVTGILHEQYDAIRATALANIPRGYKILKPIKIRANEYGAPTTRTRVFFIGYNPKRMAKELSEADFMPQSHHVPVVVSSALQGLPLEICDDWISEASGWRRINFGEMESGAFFERVTNSIPRGIGDPLMIARYQDKGEVSGCMGTRHTDAVRARYAALAYGQQDQISGSVRLNPNGFCPTLRAGTGSDKGSFQAVRPIHYHQPRVITPREAARLQGFPDWFVFHATKWHSFRQIGNSVSPIVGEQVLSILYNSIA